VELWKNSEVGGGVGMGVTGRGEKYETDAKETLDMRGQLGCSFGYVI